MAKKLRKMLGRADAPEAVALMRLIDTQRKATICNWCIGYAEEHLLPIFENIVPMTTAREARLPLPATILAARWRSPSSKTSS